MSNQPPRRLTKKEQIRLDHQRREEKRTMAAKNRRKANVIILSCGIVAILLFGGVTTYAIISGKTSTPTPVSLQYPAVDNISCDHLEHTDFHIHEHLTIYVNGQQVPIPAGVGIAPDGSCYYWLHTHDAKGVIHVEAPNRTDITLKTFFDLWSSKFPQLGYPSQLDQTSGWQVYVNGTLYTGDFRSINIQDHTLITLAYNSPGIQPDTTYNWSGV